jgi:hypothetical protein
MSVNDIRIKDVGGRNVIPTETWQVAASATLILPGEPVKITTAGAKYVSKLADAEPTTTVKLLGIAKSTSTNTASVDGVVEVYLVDETTTLELRAKSAAAADTDAEILALEGKRVGFDLTSSVYTLDTTDADAGTNGVRIIGGNKDAKTIYVRPLSGGLDA